MKDKQTSGILDIALHNIDAAAQRLKLEETMWVRLRCPIERIQICRNPVLRDGTIGVQAFVVRHNDALGPSKGGIRMAADVTLDEITGLAMEMTWKTSLIGVPFGGGKSGIRVDPAALGSVDKETIIRSFTRAARRHIGPEIYIPAPDMGTNESDMGHIRDCISYSAGTSITDGCFVTGKPVILGGIAGRREATGKGVVATVASACAKRSLDIKKCRVAVQGFGNVGAVAAAEIARRGAKVVAVSDVSGGILNPDGIDIRRLAAHVLSTNRVQGFEGGVQTEKEAVLAVDCDILIPAAGGSQITLDNARSIRAQIIAEGANMPTTPEADDVLNARGALIIPDILCNAGGVYVSYLEYAQETQREQWTLDDVEKRLAERMALKFDQVYTHAVAANVSLRVAAMDIAVQRVADAVTARGFLP